MSNDILDDFSPYSNPLKQELQKYINKEEQILWAERPKQGFIFSVGCLSVFGLGIIISMTFWMAIALFLAPDIIMALFGIPFVLIGLYYSIGRFFHDRHIRKKMIYGLTNQRVFIKKGAQLSALDISAITDMKILKQKDDAGSISLSSRCGPQNYKADSSSSFSTFNTSFYMSNVLNVDSIYHQIEALRKLDQT